MSVIDDVAEVLRPREPVARNRRTPVIGGIIIATGLFSLFVFGLGTHAGSHSQLTFDPLSIVNAPWHTGALTFDAHWTNIAIGVVMILIGVEVLWRRPRRFVMGRFGHRVAALPLHTADLGFARTGTLAHQFHQRHLAARGRERDDHGARVRLALGHHVRALRRGEHRH